MTATDTPCARCGLPKDRPYSSTAKYCVPCAIKMYKERAKAYRQRVKRR